MYKVHFTCIGNGRCTAVMAAHRTSELKIQNSHKVSFYLVAMAKLFWGTTKFD